MVLKINFRRLVKNKTPEEEIKAYNWHFNSHKELPRPQNGALMAFFGVYTSLNVLKTMLLSEVCPQADIRMLPRCKQTT